MNRKQRRAEGKAGKDAILRSSGLLEDTLFRQAIGHHQAGQLRDAEARYRDVLASNPRHTGALSYLGLLAHQAGHSEAGIDLLRKAIASDKRNPEPHYNLARVLSDGGRDDEAIVHNRKTLEISPDFPGAYNNLGALLLLQGRSGEALAAAAAGLRTEDTAGLKSTFVMALRSIDPAKIEIDPHLVQLLVRALNEPWCRPRDLSAAAGAILLRSPSMARCAERSSHAGPARLSELFSHGDLATLGSDGLFEALLGAAPVTTIGIEQVLTALRRALLDSVSSGALDVQDAWLPVAVALAKQSFINEYVFAVADEETSRLVRLRDAVLEALERGERIAPVTVAVLASYMPLHSLPDAERLVSQSWPEPVTSLAAQQIVNPRHEHAIRSGIARLTAVEDAVSEKVRAQYEENPYPRWTRIFAEAQPLPVDHYIGMRFPFAPYRAMGSRALDVLVAGCGTGQHAIQRALQFRSANVLAIDLSLGSLSYAIRKTRELGLTNLHYAQADILALDVSKTFDIVDSSGVLHHLQDPLKGWRRLADLVRPGGLMHIGLYSATARRDINAARAHLVEAGRGYSADEVRRFRADFASRAPGDPLHNVTQFSDFFSTSECRDLLFHVQEHQFSIPQIADFLREAGFTFLGFETPARTSYLKRFPDDRAAVDLANWNVFESENPATFAQMYQFWIQKA